MRTRGFDKLKGKSQIFVCSTLLHYQLNVNLTGLKMISNLNFYAKANRVKVI